MRVYDDLLWEPQGANALSFFKSSQTRKGGNHQKLAQGTPQPPARQQPCPPSSHLWGSADSEESKGQNNTFSSRSPWKSREQVYQDCTDLSMSPLPPLLQLQSFPWGHLGALQADIAAPRLPPPPQLLPDDNYCRKPTIPFTQHEAARCLKPGREDSSRTYAKKGLRFQEKSRTLWKELTPTGSFLT